MGTATYTRGKRSGWRAAGLCGTCGREPKPGSKHCERCVRRYTAQRERRKNAGLCTTCYRPKAGGVVSCQRCRDAMAERKRQTREAAFRGYGGKCSCCGDADLAVLELDHVNGDGAAHRREVGKGHAMYSWAIRNGFPDCLQLLCGSCHRAKTRTGDCSYRARMRGTV